MRSIYLDTSVLIRHLLGHPAALKRWGDWDEVFLSELTKVELFRTLDRMRLADEVEDRTYGFVAEQFAAVWAHSIRIPVSAGVLERASQPFPTPLGTLDAIHLSSLLLAEQLSAKRLRLLTHDRQLALAARACGVASSGVDIE